MSNLRKIIAGYDPSFTYNENLFEAGKLKEEAADFIFDNLAIDTHDIKPYKGEPKTLEEPGVPASAELFLTGEISEETLAKKFNNSDNLSDKDIELLIIELSKNDYVLDQCRSLLEMLVREGNLEVKKEKINLDVKKENNYIVISAYITI